jgi:dTDP-L-rhamnose 4-epimerase
MRALISDISQIATLGYRPSVTLAQGIERYLAWIRLQGDIRDYFAAAERGLRRKQIIKPAASRNQPGTAG